MRQAVKKEKSKLIGHYDSPVLRANDDIVKWGTIEYDGYNLESAKVTISTRTSPDGSSWTPWVESKDTKILSPTQRFIQYRVYIESEDDSPVINYINLFYIDSSSHKVRVRTSRRGDWVRYQQKRLMRNLYSVRIRSIGKGVPSSWTYGSTTNS